MHEIVLNDKFEVTYITKVCQKLRLLDAPIEFLNKQLSLKRFIFVFLSLHWILQIDLFNKLPEKVLIEILSKLT